MHTGKSTIKTSHHYHQAINATTGDSPEMGDCNHVSEEGEAQMPLIIPKRGRQN